MPVITEGRGKTYKIGCYAHVRNAKRHLVKSFIAANEDAATTYFSTYVSMKGSPEKYTYYLYNGDWSKQLAKYKAEVLFEEGEQNNGSEKEQ